MRDLYSEDDGVRELARINRYVLERFNRIVQQGMESIRRRNEERELEDYMEPYAQERITSSGSSYRLS